MKTTGSLMPVWMITRCLYISQAKKALQAKFEQIQADGQVCRSWIVLTMLWASDLCVV